MAENRRRVRDVSECSESELNNNESADLSVTECESDTGVLSQNATVNTESEELDVHEELEHLSDGEVGSEDDDAGSAENTETGDEEEEEEESDGSEMEETGTDVTDGEPDDAAPDDDGADNDGGWSSEKRLSGDGQEHVDTAGNEKKPDIDEDKSNPAYIPRKGNFYEHDMRNDDDDNAKTKDTKEEANKRRLWTTDNRKWSHDRYDEHSQAPKSTSELVAIYGYDIRSRDSPPSNDSLQRGGNRRARGRQGPRATQRLGDFLPTRNADRNADVVGNDNRHSDDPTDVPVHHRDDDDDNDSRHFNNAPYSNERGPRGRGQRGGRYSGMRQPRFASSKNDRQQPTGDTMRFQNNERVHERQMHEGGRSRGQGGGYRGFGQGDRYHRGPRIDDRSERNEGREIEYHSEGRAGKPEVRSSDGGVRDGRSRDLAGRGDGGYRVSDEPVRVAPQTNLHHPRLSSEDWDAVEDGVVTATITVGETRPGLIEGSEVQQGRGRGTYDERRADQGAVRYKTSGGEPRTFEKEIHGGRLANAQGPPRHSFGTRTVSNKNYVETDSLPSSRDRKSQIGSVVDAMNRITVTGPPNTGKFGEPVRTSRLQAGSKPQQKSTVIVNTSNSTEIIPPVTQTQTRTVMTSASSGGPSRNDHRPVADTAAAVASSSVRREGVSLGAEYSSSSRPVPAASHPTANTMAAAAAAGKPKRYSTQRQRPAAETESAGGDQLAADAAVDINSGNAASSSVRLSSKPQQQQPPTIYYDVDHTAAMPYTSQQQQPQQAHLVPVSNIPYRMPAMPPVAESFYRLSQPVSQQSGTGTHQAAQYIGAAPSQMMTAAAQVQPGQCYMAAPPPMYGYTPQMMAAPQPYRLPPPPMHHHQYLPPSASAASPQLMASEVSPSMEVRSGMVYFNTETQQPEVRVGGIYYGPSGQQPPSAAAVPVRRPNSAIPIINPQQAAADEAGIDATSQYYQMAPLPNYVYSNYPPLATTDQIQYSYGTAVAGASGGSDNTRILCDVAEVEADACYT